MTHFGRCGHETERAERVIQQTFVHILVKASNEQVGSDIQLLLIRGCLESG